VVYQVRLEVLLQSEAIYETLEEFEGDLEEVGLVLHQLMRAQEGDYPYGSLAEQIHGFFCNHSCSLQDLVAVLVTELFFSIFPDT
jgi:hypothetical protein